jgi:hypothetical protein
MYAAKEDVCRCFIGNLNEVIPEIKGYVSDEYGKLLNHLKDTFLDPGSY